MNNCRILLARFHVSFFGLSPVDTMDVRLVALPVEALPVLNLISTCEDNNEANYMPHAEVSVFTAAIWLCNKSPCLSVA